LKRLTRALGWTALALIVAALIGALVIVQWARSQSGRRAILTRVLSAARDRLDGTLRIGALDGDLTHTLVLRDVELRDAEGQLVLRVATLSLSYELSGLLHHELVIDDLTIDGATVHARSLGDGRFNLASLVKPSSSTPSSVKKPYAIVLRRVRAEIALAYDPPGGKAWMRAIAGTVRLDASASSDGDRRTLVVTALAARMTLPVIVAADVSGAFVGGPEGPTLASLHVTADTIGDEMEKLSAVVTARGGWHADVRAKGPLRAMAVDVVVTPPTGSIAAHGSVGVTGRGATWRGAATARALDPATLWRGLPHGVVAFDGDGDGENARVRTTLTRFDAEVAGARAAATGQLTYRHALALTISADVDARDLTRLPALGVSGLSGLSGSAKVHADVVRAAGKWKLDAAADAHRLAGATTAMARLTAELHARDVGGELRGSARAQASAIDVGPRLRFDAATAAVVLAPRTVSLSLAALGPRGAELALAAHGARLLDEGAFAVDLALDRVRVAVAGAAWQTRSPGRLRCGKRELAARVELGDGDQRLDLDGTYKEGGDTRAHLAGRNLDVQALARMAQLDRALPPGKLDLDATIRGTTAQPIFDLALAGSIAADQALGLGRASYDVKGHYAHENLAGTLTVAALPMARMAPFLPRSLRTVSGVLDGKVTIAGTRRAPEVTVELATAHWQWDALIAGGTQLDARYADHRLQAKLSSALAGAAGAAGAVEVELFAPIDLSRDLSRDRGRGLVERLVHTTPITVAVRLHALDLQRLPLDRLGLQRLVTTGIVDGELAVAGTLHEPMLTAVVQARRLTVEGIAALDLTLHADYRHAHLGLALTVDLQGARLLAADAETPLDFHQLIDGRRWQDAPLRADAAIAHFDLARWKPLHGALTLHAHVGGTLAHPEGDVDFSVAELGIAELRFDRFAGAGHYDAQRTRLSLDAVQHDGGTLRASGELDAGKRLDARLQIARLSLSLGKEGLGPLRELRGNVAADVKLSGTLAEPLASGSLTVDGGVLALRAQPLVYRDLLLALTANGDRLALERLSVKVGNGSLDANGSAQLDGSTAPLGVDVTAKAARFPVRLGSIAAFVDGQVTLHGRRDRGVLALVATVSDGLAQLPRIVDGKRAQSLAPMPDVVFSDRAERRRVEEARRPTMGVPIHATLAAHIPGPFRLRSSELGTDLEGDLDVAVVGQDVRVTGAIASSWGRIDLLGRRYEIERVRVSFDGAAKTDPALDIELERAVGDAVVIIRLRGTLDHPELELASEPPIYNQSQIIGIIVSGDPGSTRISSAASDQTIVGAISGVLVNQIRSQIAPGLPIDVIRIDSDSALAGTSRLEVGKYLTQSIYLSYLHQFGTPSGLHPVNANEAQLQYRFRRHYQVETKFGDAGVGAVNFYWSRRF
jgi:autotransporter translocation and assembly factor TamB